MVKTRELSISDRSKIIAYSKLGVTYRSIAAELGCSIGTVSYNIKKYQNTEEVVKKLRSGRKDSLSTKEKKAIVINSVRNRHKSVAVLTSEFNITRQQPVSLSTVRKVLIKNNLNGRVAAKKPFLRSQNIQKRLKFAKDHQHWTVEDWKRVFFTDESKFELFGSKRRAYVRRRPHERYRKHCILPTVKHGGGSIMVWGSVSANGVGPLKLIEGIMDKTM